MPQASEAIFGGAWSLGALNVNPAHTAASVIG